jgi:LPS sulfotransferase NodH
MTSEKHIMSERFIIFSLSRCGSTTLMRSLNFHPDIRCALEPFNNAAPGNHTNYLERVSDAASLDATLEEIWTAYNGIKHVWHPLGWPFAENSDFNRLLMSRRGQRVLFLNRRNDLRRLVSAEMSIQSGVWAVLDDVSRERLRETEFKPLDIAKIKSRLDLDKRVVSQHRQYLVDNRLDFMELWYEDLFNTISSREQTKDEFNRILAFLGRSAITDGETLARVDDLWRSDRIKQSSEAIYRMIPGIDEVEEICGSDITGWLFRGNPVRV